jgi:hypothetical protein
MVFYQMTGGGVEQQVYPFRNRHPELWLAKATTIGIHKNSMGNSDETAMRRMSFRKGDCVNIVR